MSAPIVLNPRQISKQKQEQMFRYSAEELVDHPTAFYAAGFDALCASGVVKPQMDQVLLRAITSSEILSRAGGVITMAGGDRIQEAQCFEIVDVGPVVKALQSPPWWRRLLKWLNGPSMVARSDAGIGTIRLQYPFWSVDHIKPGHHCISIASAADALDATGDGIFQMVRACFIPCAWDPDAARKGVLAALEQIGDGIDRVRAEQEAAIAHYQTVMAEQREKAALERQMMLEAWERGEGDHPDGEAKEEAEAGPQAPMVVIPRHHRSAG